MLTVARILDAIAEGVAQLVAFAGWSFLFVAYVGGLFGLVAVVTWSLTKLFAGSV